MRRLRLVMVGLVAVSLVVCAQTGASASASKQPGGKNHSTSTTNTLSLSSEVAQLNPNAPPWCLTEDDYDQRVFSGSLSGSSTASYRLCDASVDYYNNVWWDAGGIGLESDVYVVGQLSDLTLSSPDGTSHRAVLMGQTTSKGVTTYHYAVCYVPPYSLLNDIAGTSLSGGTWQVALAGQISSARWAVNALMTDVSYQQTYCPPTEQDLVSS